MKYSSKCPETAIVFTTYGRSATSMQSVLSLISALEKWRDRVKLVVSDATDDIEKAKELASTAIDDLIWTPRSISAASQRNLCVTYILDKFSTKNICFLEDDYLYTSDWYPSMIEAVNKYYGTISPWGLAYGVFSSSQHNLENDRIKMDAETGLLAYIFGAVADQRFMPLAHYLSVFRFWDSDLLGISYCQTGMQTARNTIRGYCGGVLTDESLCYPIETAKSTWRKKKRDVGPPAHDFDTRKYKVYCDIMNQTASKERNGD